MPAMASTSMYSRMLGSTPLLTMCGTACATSARVANGRQNGGRLGQARLDLQGDFGGDGQRPLRADEQLREVVARGDLHELAAGAHDGAVGQHDLEAEDVMSGHAVADGTHAAGVRGDVAPEGRARLARARPGR